MFFILSKLLAFIIKPLNWAIVLCLWAFLTKKAHVRRRTLKFGAIVLVVFSNPFIINFFYQQYESGQCAPASITEPYEVGILLGGYSNLDAQTPEGVQQFNLASNRLTETLALYKSGKIKNILLSGGVGRLIGDVRPEALIVREYLLRVGVPDSVIWIDQYSRNTRENAVYSKQIVEERRPNGANCLLITSAFHMRRSLCCFQKVGLPVTPYAADYWAESDSGNFFRLMEPDWKAFLKWDMLIKEWIGLMAYKMQGYI